MNADQIINEYVRLAPEEQVKFEQRFKRLLGFRRRSRQLLKEMRRAGVPAVLGLNGSTGKVKAQAR